MRARVARKVLRRWPGRTATINRALRKYVRACMRLDASEPRGWHWTTSKRAWRWAWQLRPIVVLVLLLAGCVPTPEGDYRGEFDPGGCFVTVGLHADYTTGRVCPDRSDTFTGAWSLEGEAVHVRFPDGTAYDLRWDGDALVDAAGTTYRRGL